MLGEVADILARSFAEDGSLAGGIAFSAETYIIINNDM